MAEVKRCIMCGAVIAVLDGTETVPEHMSAVRRKYCPECALTMRRLCKANCSRKERSMAKQASKAKDEVIKSQRDRIAELENENQKLRDMIGDLR